MSQHEQAFTAAVNIIRSMPKDGPFQPSPDMMLRFYGLYKQATLGKCTEPKPSFWAVIAKAKWDAWKSHGNMPKEEAMKKYVEGLKEIVETMSYSDDVAKFMHVLGPFYEAVYDGQEPENLRLRRTPSPQPSDASAVSSSSSSTSTSTEKEDESGYSSSINGNCSNTESADLEVENNNNNVTNKKKEPVLAEEEKEVLVRGGGGEEEEEGALVSPAASYASLYASDKFYSDAEESDEDEYKDPIDLPADFHHLHPKSSATFYNSKNKTTMNTSSGTGEQLHVTMAIQRLQADLQAINNRLDALEKTQQQTANSAGSTTLPLNKRSTVEATGSFAATYSAIPSVNQLSLPSWFPFKNVNLATIIVILGWPFVAQYVMSSARLRHRRLPSSP